jgi:outer membrane protein assembly factor BamB
MLGEEAADKRRKDGTVKRHRLFLMRTARVQRMHVLASLLLLAIPLMIASPGAWTETPSHAAPAADEWPTLAHDAQRTGGGASAAGGPYAIRWGWNTIQGPATLRLGGNVQPVVASGRLFVGTLDGTFVALDASTGAELWRAQTGDAILGTAAIAGQTVFVGSQDGRIHAYDAATGAEQWTYATKGGIWAAPLVVENSVAIGSRDGLFYALDAASGALRWSFAAGAPITMSAAYSERQHLVYIGAENSQAFALDLQSGALRWQQQLAGQGFRAGWPVVADVAGLVVFRTMPAYYFGDLWAGSEGHFLDSLQGMSILDEQTAIRRFLSEHPDHQTFHALNAATGERAFVAPVLYVGGDNLPPAPPVLNTDGALLVLYSTRQNYRIRAGEMWDARWSADFGTMDLRDGAIAPVLLSNDDHGRVDGVWPFRLITDEGGSISRAGTRLLQSEFEAAGGVDLATGATFHLGIEYRNVQTPRYPSGGVTVYSSPPQFSRFPPDDAHFWLGAGVANSPIVSAGGLLFWRLSGGAVVAIGGAS